MAPDISVFDRMKVQGKLKMGFSVAVEGKNKEGSMGGFVTLTHNGKLRNGFLTNYHVVRAKKSVVDEDIMIRFEMDRFGNSANHEKNPTICLGEKEKNNIQEEEEKLKFEDNQKKMAGFDPESQKSIDSSTQCIEDYLTGNLRTCNTV
jgi:hypothetical protein